MKTDEAMKSIYGEEYKGDTLFVAECRKLQSIYRVEIGEDIRPYKDRNGHIRHYGNYISNGEVAKDGCWKNFLTEHAFNYATERVKSKKPYETIETDRLFNNLLSSQPMAFNLFCPLRQMLEESPEAATRAIKAALAVYHIHKITEVDLEFIPENYGELTGDKSAMDAIIKFIGTDGKKAFIAVETKYSENLGTNVASKREKSIEAIKHLNCFTPDAEKSIMEGKTPLTQIYRNFMLSERYGGKEDLQSYSIILAPERHPSTKTEINSLTDALRDEYKDKIKQINLEDFVNAIIHNCPNEYRMAFERFYDRYLNFGKLEKF